MRDFLSKYLNVYWLAPGLALWRAIEARIIKETNIEIHSPSIDLGCGDGVFSWILEDGDFEINHDCYKKEFGNIGRKPEFCFDIGLDINYEILKRAKGIEGYKQYVQGAIEFLPFKKNTFNTMFCNGVIEHCPELDKVLNEINRVLKPEGSFFTTVSTDCFCNYLVFYPLASKLNKWGFQRLAQFFFKIDNKRCASHIHQYTPKQWETRLMKSGFSPVYNKRYLSKRVIQLWDIEFRTSLFIKISNFLGKFGMRNLVKGIIITLTRVFIYKYYKDKSENTKGAFVLLVAKKQ